MEAAETCKLIVFVHRTKLERKSYQVMGLLMNFLGLTLNVSSHDDVMLSWLPPPISFEQHVVMSLVKRLEVDTLDHQYMNCTRSSSWVAWAEGKGSKRQIGCLTATSTSRDICSTSSAKQDFFPIQRNYSYIVLKGKQRNTHILFLLYPKLSLAQ